MSQKRPGFVAWIAGGVLTLGLVLTSGCSGDGDKKVDQEQTEGCESSGGQPETGLKVLGGQYEVFNTSIIKTTDCANLTAGYAKGGNTDLVLTKLGQADAMWAKQYTSDRVKDSIVDRGPVVTTGMKEPGALLSWVSTVARADGGAAVVHDSVLLAVDRDGNPEWAKQYKSILKTGPSVLIDLAFTSVVKVDGGFIVLTNKMREGGTSYDTPALIRFDEQGKVVWAKHYFGMEIELNSPLILTKDGHLLVGGFVRDDKGRTPGAVASLRLDGSVEWLRLVEMEPLLEIDSEGLDFPWISSGFQTLGLGGNGDIILVQNYTNHGALITRLSMDGEHQWSRMLHWTRAAGANYTWVTQIVADGNDLLIIGSSRGFQTPQANYNAFLARLDYDGTPVWIRSLGQTPISPVNQARHYSDFGTAMLLTPDKQLLLTGYTDSFSARQPYAQYRDPSHFDGFVALANSEGLIRGAGGLLQTPDITDQYEVWTRATPATVESTSLQAVQFEVSSQKVTYTASDAGLKERTLPSEEGKALELTYKTSEKELVSNVSMFQDKAGDIDGDTLRQEWENQAIELLKPIIEIDEEEDWLLHRQDHPVVHFVRVTPWPSPEEPRYILVYYGVIWSADYGGGPWTQNPILTIEDHRGDVEKLVMALKVIGDRRAKLEWVLTSAHGENTHTGVWNVRDRSCSLAIILGKYGEDDSKETICDKLAFNNKGQPVVQASEDKHALYPSIGLCESVTLVALPGKDWGEDCGWEPSNIPVVSEIKKLIAESVLNDDSRYRGNGRWQFDAFNIGEPDHRLIDDLGNPTSWQGLTPEQVQSLTGKYPGETVWRGWTAYDTPDHDHKGFCGGLDTDLLDLDYLANPDRCVGAPAGSLEMTPQLQDKIDSYYRVTITTAGREGAGTDAAITVRLENKRGDFSGEVAGSFERGDVDTIHMGLVDFGPIDTVWLSRDDFGEDPFWLVTKIVVEQKRTGEERVWSSTTGAVITPASLGLQLSAE